MKYPELLEHLLSRQDLTGKQARQTMDRVMDGEWDEARIGGFLTAMRAKGETSEEIAGFAASMRSHAKSFSIQPEYRPLVDTCGTGGDSVESINISTLSALVAAGCGVRVAKHGNRSVSSKCGSADLLEALGVKLELEPETVRNSIEEVGIGFMYAPAFHGAMKHAIGPRKSLGIRTVFNLLGPLTNPADADRQLLGVFSSKWVRPVAEALQQLGIERALVVHGEIGMDEISLKGQTRYAEVNEAEITEGRFRPSDFGLKPINLEEIAGGDIETNRKIAEELFDAQAPEAIESIISVNAGAVIYLGGEADSIRNGIERARQSIQSGKARHCLHRLVEFTQSATG